MISCMVHAMNDSRSRWLALAVLAIAQFMVVLDVTIVNVALPAVTFPAGRERNIALGVWGALAGIGGTLGVVAGGVLVDSLGWEWIFIVNVPVAAIAMIAAPMFITESRRSQADSS